MPAVACTQLALVESYTYSNGADGDGTLTQMTTGHGKTISYTYDALKRLTGKNVVNGAKAVVAHAYAYKDRSTANGITTTTPLVEFHNVRTKDDSLLTGAKYTYDALGNITQISQSTGSYYPLVKYTYDSQNQLTKEVHYNGSGTATSNITKTYEYTYDTAGNLLSEKVNGTTTKTYTYGNSQWIDLLTSFNGYKIVYQGQTYNASTDELTGTLKSGNPIRYSNGQNNYSLQWKNVRQLASATVVDPTDGSTDYTLTFNYDFDGIRTKKVVNGVTHEYITQNGRVVRETIGTGTTAKILDFIYDESGNPCALIYTNGTATPLTYYYVLNLQGDVVKIVNSEGVSRAEYTYNAWGELLSSSGTMASINPLRYRGYYYDTETGWYYLQSRYYDPAMHRFINADVFASTGQGFLGTNMFAYCGNNPVSNVDHTGQSWADFWDFLRDAFKEATQAMENMSVAYAGCGATAAADGPLPIGDIIGGVAAVLITAGAFGYGFYQASTKTRVLPTEQGLSDIAGRYKLKECVEAAAAMKKYGGDDGKIISLYFPTARGGYVCCDRYRNAISENGRHYGYLYDGIVYCNVYPEGREENHWINSFFCADGSAPIVRYLG